MSKHQKIEAFTCTKCNKTASSESRIWWAYCQYCYDACCWDCLDDNFGCALCNITWQLENTHISSAEDPYYTNTDTPGALDWTSCFKLRPLSKTSLDWHDKLRISWWNNRHTTHPSSASTDIPMNPEDDRQWRLKALFFVFIASSRLVHC